MGLAYRQQLKSLVTSTTPDEITRTLPHCDARDITAVQELIEQYQSLDTTLKQAQDTGRGISRQIGEAKQQGRPADVLIAQMQQHSYEARRIKSDMQALEEKILAYFNMKQEQPRDDVQRQTRTTGRSYPDTSCAHDIAIAQLGERADAWDRYVEANKAASVYHLAAWREVIHRAFGHESVYFYAHGADGIIKGVLPLVRLKSRLFGDFLVSMPFFNYGGPIADHPQIEVQLVAYANAYAKELGVSHVEYRDDIEISGTPTRMDKVNMLLALPDDEDALWQSFTPKLRAQIRRPQRENIEAAFGGIELLDDFYTVFARNMRDLGTPVYAKSLFARILEAFPAQSRIIIVRLNGKPVGTAFLIGYRDMLEIPWASTIRDVNHLGVNMYMYWEVLRYAIAQGYRVFDFGRSSVDSGTYQFKKQWGAEPKQLYWHYWLNGSEMPALNPSNPKYKLLINVWKRLPVWLTRLIGPPIVKNLP